MVKKLKNRNNNLRGQLVTCRWLGNKERLINGKLILHSETIRVPWMLAVKLANQLGPEFVLESE